MKINEAANDLTDEEVADDVEHWFSLLDRFQDKFGTMVVPQDVRAAARDNNIFLCFFNVTAIHSTPADVVRRWMHGTMRFKAGKNDCAVPQSLWRDAVI